MEEKYLGKIINVEFGQDSDRPFMFGLQLTFGFEGGGVTDGGQYTFNLNNEPWLKSGKYKDKWIYIEDQMIFIDKILTDAKVNYVSQLKGKPIEVIIENQIFKDFRILTEVL